LAYVQEGLLTDDGFTSVFAFFWLGPRTKMILLANGDHRDVNIIHGWAFVRSLLRKVMLSSWATVARNAAWKQ